MNKVELNFLPIPYNLSHLYRKDLLGYSPSWPLEKGYLKYIEWYNNFKKKL